MRCTFVIPALLAACSAEAPSRIKPRATTMCGQWDSVQTGTYTVYQDLWGMSSGTGSQCSTVNSLSGTSLSWSTSWSWSGGQGQVKSYANVVASTPVVLVSAVSSLQSVWKWSYTGTSIVANVAYDIFTSSTASGSAEYEIMIWLAALGGAGPISSTGSPVATPTVAGVSWSLYSGYNGNMRVFSFVASSQQTNFSGDLKAFITNLISSQGMSSSQYLQSIGAGTEAFTGSNAVLSVSAYSLTYSGGSGSGTTTTTTAKPTTTSGGGSCATLYAQCGGQGWTGPTCCSQGSCKYSNDWYSQCL